MNSTIPKNCSWPLIAGILVCCLTWTASALAVNIQVGGGRKLDLSRFEIVHQETFESGRAPGKIFWGVLDVGQKAGDPWVGTLTRGAYVLTHSGTPGAVRYYFRQRLDEAHAGTLSENALSVEISGTMNGENSGAGLIFAYHPQVKHYMAFVICAGHSYAIYKRNAQGLRRIMAGTSDAVKSHQANQLAIVPDGTRIHFYINNTPVAALKDEPASGGAGILAISSGMFLFDNFTLYAARQPQELPGAPRPGDQPPSPAKAAKEKTAPAGDHALTETTATQTPVQLPDSRYGNRGAYKKALKTGMPKQDVIKILGQPAYLRGSRLFYYLDEEDGGAKERSTLIIQFDENDALLSYKEVHE